VRCKLGCEVEARKKVHYMDQRSRRNMRDDKHILKPLWKLLNEADIVVTQNGKAFDEKKLNARFIINGFPPVQKYLHADTKQLAKRRFGFTYNSLEYLCEALKVPFKKQKSKVFIGQDLWTECLKRNLKAWDEMKNYNIQDVLATEACFDVLAKWGIPGIDLRVFEKFTDFRCECGSRRIIKDGTRANSQGIYQRYRCKNCGRSLAKKRPKIQQAFS
jgi:hypothetical protein